MERINRFSIHSPILLLILSVLFFLIIDNLVYRTHFYSDHILPSRNMYHQLEKILNEPKTGKERALIIGNSLVNKGFDLGQFNLLTPNFPYQVQVLGVNATEARSWYYLLKRLKDKIHYKFIVVCLDEYKSEPTDEGILNYSEISGISSILAPRDIPEFITDTVGSDMRKGALTLSLFSSHIYGPNLQDMLVHFKVRRKEFEEFKKNPFASLAKEQSMADIHFNSAGQISYCPKERKKLCSKIINKLGLGRPSSLSEAKRMEGRYTEYTQKWLNKIIDLYRGDTTKIIFIKMPYGPKIISHRTPLDGAPDIRNLVSTSPNVSFTNEKLFDDLETPIYCADMDHLNQLGSRIFTKRMALLLSNYVRTLS